MAELDGVGNVEARFVYGLRGHVPDYMIKDGATYRIVSDHLGSVRLAVNEATGQVVQRIEYDEFGNVILDTNPGFQPFGFAGGIYENTTEIIRFGIRDFDPNIGRWTMVDPSKFHSGEVNLFLYCSNDPINLIDVRGLDFSITQELPWWWLMPAIADGPLLIGDAIAVIGVTYTLLGSATHQEIDQNLNPLAHMSDAEDRKSVV